jgi:hypothetical protein
MPQLHVYLSDDVTAEIRRRAEARGIPVSRFLAELITRHFARGWPPGFFDRVVGGWKGEPLTRAPQGDFERRQPL